MRIPADELDSRTARMVAARVRSRSIDTIDGNYVSRTSRPDCIWAHQSSGRAWLWAWIGGWLNGNRCARKA